MQAERALMKWACNMCKTVMTDPVCTPCAHHFCSICLHTAFDDAGGAAPAANGRRTGRARKQAKRCPRCNHDLFDFMKGCQVNRAMAAEIAAQREKAAAAGAKVTAERARLLRDLQELDDVALAPPLDASAEGWYVRLWWPDEEEWFTGMVKAHKDATKFVVSYLDGDVQEHDLAQEQMQWLVMAASGASLPSSAKTSLLS
jgi:RING-type zinc-finger